MKKSHVLSAQGERTAKKGKGIRRKKFDYSDIPELSQRQLASLRRVGRPPIGDEPRKLIAIRLDPRILEWVRKTAARKRLPYQSLINDILAREMKNAKGVSSLTKSFE